MKFESRDGNDQLKLALVSLEYPPFYGGGIGTFAANLADMLTRRGVEVHVVTNDWRDEDDCADPLARSHGRLFVHRTPALRQSAGAGSTTGDRSDFLQSYSPILDYAWRILPLLDRVLETHRIDVIEAAECGAEVYPFLLRRERLGTFSHVACNITCHSPIFEIQKHNRADRFAPEVERRKQMEDTCVRLADTLSAPSRCMEETIAGRIGMESTRAGRIARIPYPFRFEQVEAASQSDRGGAHGRAFFFCPGRLEARKGPQIVVAALRQLADWGLRPDVVFAGATDAMFGAPMREYLQSLAGPSLWSQLHFLGKVPRETLFGYYRDALATVCASPWDNFPNTCIESLAAGTAVIGSDGTGMVELIDDGATGSLFRSGDFMDLARKMRQAIQRPEEFHDAGRRAAADIRNRLDEAEIYRQRMALYETAIRSRADEAGGSARASVSVKNRLSASAIVLADGDGPAIGDALRRALESRNIDCRSIRHAVDRNAAAGLSMAELFPELPDALQQAAGDLIALLHSGDEPSDEYFDDLLAFMERNPETGAAVSWMSAAGSGIEDYAALDFSKELALCDPLPPALLIRKESLSRCELDWLASPRFWLIDLLLQLQENGRPMRTLPGFRGVCRRNVWAETGASQTFQELHFLYELCERRPVSSSVAGWRWAGQALSRTADSKEWAIRKCRAIFDDMKAAGKNRLAVYGAGRHTRGIAAALIDAPLAAVLDDAPRPGATLFGLPVVSPERAKQFGVDAVLLSSDAFENELWRKSVRFARQGMTVYRLYADPQILEAERRLARLLEEHRGRRLAAFGDGRSLWLYWERLLRSPAPIAGLVGVEESDEPLRRLAAELDLPALDAASLAPSGVEAVLAIGADAVRKAAETPSLFADLPIIPFE